MEVNEIAVVVIHTSPNDAVKEINALDEVRKWVTKRYGSYPLFGKINIFHSVVRNIYNFKVFLTILLTVLSIFEM